MALGGALATPRRDKVHVGFAPSSCEHLASPVAMRTGLGVGEDLFLLDETSSQQAPSPERNQAGGGQGDLRLGTNQPVNF